MSEMDNFFKGFQRNMIGNMNTCLPCEIISFDPTLMKANVKTLPSGDLINSVPVQAPQTSEFIIRVPYKPGDLGLLVFAQREIDSVMYGVGETSTRKMAIDDAIFIGGINPYSAPMPAEHENDVVISKKDFSAKIVLTGDGEILLKPQSTRKLVIDSPGGVDIKGGNITMTGESITANGEDLSTDNV